ncbi:hypothetical protein HAX54_053435 [Datura stramonium]|uniref:Uncharacterized protein n=1 Tax=Datura stramonium TaxID=4076 RepID=A0ABS8T192_DATST|nr:hypothetical protein [Datura stramonium]
MLKQLTIESQQVLFQYVKVCRVKILVRLERRMVFGGLHIFPDVTTGFFSCTQITKAIMSCIKLFYGDAWITWREIRCD